MKKKMVVFYSLMFLPLVVVLIALQFLPEQIPAHYDMNNQVTRWGSKYETLIFPVITVLFGYFMLAMAKLSSKQEENGSNNKNVCIVTGIASLALFNAMTVYFLYADFNSIENLSSIALDIIIIIVCFLTKGFSCFWRTMSIVAVLLIIDTCYTYTLSKKY